MREERENGRGGRERKREREGRRGRLRRPGFDCKNLMIVNFEFF